MKEYIFRLKNGTGTHTFVLWWVMRIAMVIAFVGNFFSSSFTLTGQIHIAVCFIASFMWELSLASSPKCIFHFLPASIHSAINVGLVISAVGGIYFNLYYDMKLFDPLLTAYFGFISVLYGYEIGYAIVRKNKYAATKAMLFYAAFGVSFILFDVWELGEFLCDQLVGVITGEPGNAQFWSVLLSEGTAREETILPALVEAREPLMDTVADMIFHSSSAFVALIFINIYPYRLRGKYRYDAEYNNNSVEKRDNAMLGSD